MLGYAGSIYLTTETGILSYTISMFSQKKKFKNQNCINKGNMLQPVKIMKCCVLIFKGSAIVMSTPTYFCVIQLRTEISSRSVYAIDSHTKHSLIRNNNGWMYAKNTHFG